MIAAVVLLAIYVPYSYIAVVLTQVAVAVRIVSSSDNPDYKVPWLFFVLLIPIIGFMLYFMFYSRRLSKKQIAKIDTVTSMLVGKDDSEDLTSLKKENHLAYSQASMLTSLSASHLYRNTEIHYYPLGEKLFAAMVNDISCAEKFIFMEYFIIENGFFWKTILDILIQKVLQGVEVRIVYDDIGCMKKLKGNYYERLTQCGIKCVPFAKLRGHANNEFNNRSHRKITVVDGKVGYTGGINIGDEYINRVEKYGHWKDVGVRLEGEAVNELTRLFLIDYNLNAKGDTDDFSQYFYYGEGFNGGYCIPFGDGPKPMYDRQVGKTAIINMLGQAQSRVFITTPYLIIDNELTQALENAALRGIDVRIITPHIPDKKMVFAMTRSYYERLMNAGVKIFEYEKGFIHAKTYIADGEIAIVGTINLDYRSLVHHFENAVWMYKVPAIADMEQDFIDTLNKSIRFEKSMLKQNLWQRFVRALVKIFAPLL